MRRLNIGCGPYPEEGYINIDKNPQSKADLVRDVRRGLPFDSDSVDAIKASHFLEHLNCDEALDFLEECWRVLKPQCAMTVTVPLRDVSAIDHKTIYSEDSFDIFGRDGQSYFDRQFSWSVGGKEIGQNIKGRTMTVQMTKK